MSHYRETPVETTRMPGGIPFIIGNELAERFSFYGMNAILTIFLANHLLDADGRLDPMDDEGAKAVFHLFKFAAYFTPILGAIIADVFLGKYRTIVTLSLLYCVGHGSLAAMDLAPAMNMHMAPFLYVGLLLIACGAGAIKPCVSAHVGDQFGTKNKGLIPKIFAWFYFSINVGAATSTILTPILLEEVGPWMAFGVPGVLMAIATFVFWLGRNRFVHVPAAGWTKFRTETFSPDGRRAIFNLVPIFLIFIPMFWALFDQTGSAWVLQSITMDRVVMGVSILPSQIQAANPLLILILIPIFTYVFYPAISKVFPLTPLRKIAIGLFIAAVAFSLSAMIETRIQDEAQDTRTAIWAELLKAQSTDNEAVRALLYAADQVKLKSVDVATHFPELAGEDVKMDLFVTDGMTAEQIADAENARGYEFLSKALGEQEKSAVASGAALNYPSAASLWPKVEALSEEGYKGLRQAARLGDEALEESQMSALLQDMPSIFWQILAYIIITAAEVMVSITSLEFAYTQAPKKMKSFIMGVYFLGVSLGNLFVSAVNVFIQNPDGSTKLEGASYYWFFTIAMVITAMVFVVYSQFYKGRTFIQGEDEAIAEAEAEAMGPERA